MYTCSVWKHMYVSVYVYVICMLHVFLSHVYPAVISIILLILIYTCVTLDTSNNKDNKEANAEILINL